MTLERFQLLRNIGPFDSVKTGAHLPPSEGLREGLRLIELREAWEAAKLEALRAAAQIGFDDLQAAGRFLDFDSFDELEDHLTRVTESNSATRPGSACTCGMETAAISWGTRTHGQIRPRPLSGAGVQ